MSVAKRFLQHTMWDSKTAANYLLISLSMRCGLHNETHYALKSKHLNAWPWRTAMSIDWHHKSCCVCLQKYYRVTFPMSNVSHNFSSCSALRDIKGWRRGVSSLTQGSNWEASLPASWMSIVLCLRAKGSSLPLMANHAMQLTTQGFEYASTILLYSMLILG